MDNTTKKEKKKMPKAAKVIMFTCFGIIGTLILIVATPIVPLIMLYNHTIRYTCPPQAEKIENTTGLVQAHDRSLYDPNGNKLRLEGMNFGNIFLQEGWLGPFAEEPLKNPDGTYVKDSENNIQYPEFTEEDFREGLYANPNCGKENFNEWFDYYFHCWVNDSDYDVLNELDLNTIRLPVYWRNFLNDDFTRKDETEAFYYIDQIVEAAKEHNLYIVFDLHGAPGSQNGLEHSGTTDIGCLLWDDEKYINATIDIWEFVSHHYMNTRSDLNATIATYDILNEPTEVKNGKTTKKCWDVFDRIYKAIRDNGDNHVITMIGCWSFKNLPNPSDYGWTNVQYQYHWYNFDKLNYDLFYMYSDIWNIGRDYNVPVYIGEFTLFEEKDQWYRAFDMYKQRNYSWTVWNFKACTNGWWSTSWGLYSAKLNLDRDKEETKINVKTCTFEEFKNTCDKLKSENCERYTLSEVVSKRNR